MTAPSVIGMDWLTAPGASVTVGWTDAAVANGPTTERLNVSCVCPLLAKVKTKLLEGGPGLGEIKPPTPALETITVRETFWMVLPDWTGMVIGYEPGAMPRVVAIVPVIDPLMFGASCT